MAENPLLSGRILVADDDAPLVRLFKAVLTGGGHDVEAVTDGETARQRITNGNFDLVLVDLTMTPVGGLELLEHTRKVSPGTTLVIITGNATVESAVEALKRGAHDYLIKPVQNEQLVCVVKRVLEMKRLGEERRQAGEALQAEKQRNATLMQEMKARHALTSLSGSSERMSEVRSMVEEVIRTDSTVLILGESGTGKSLLARTIHFNGHRAEQPFVETNCAIYSEGLLMSELFGHESGAFTGALRQKKGRFELAEGGTVFLDEIGDIPGATQIALLRFLQERRFERVGGEKTFESDVRVLAATNRDLTERMRKGVFRQDLFYRLNVIPITLPPLRERREDIELLAGHILSDCSARLRREVKGFTSDALEALMSYPWPGNIREMENAIERAVLLTHGDLVSSLYLPRRDGGIAPAPIAGRQTVPPPSASSLEENERHHIVRVLEQCHWNKKKTAGMLGISRSSLYSKLRRFGLLEDDASPRAEVVGAAGTCPDGGHTDSCTRP